MGCIGGPPIFEALVGAHACAVCVHTDTGLGKKENISIDTMMSVEGGWGHFQGQVTLSRLKSQEHGEFLSQPVVTTWKTHNAPSATGAPGKHGDILVDNKHTSGLHWPDALTLPDRQDPEPAT